MLPLITNFAGYLTKERLIGGRRGRGVDAFDNDRRKPGRPKFAEFGINWSVGDYFDAATRVPVKVLLFNSFPVKGRTLRLAKFNYRRSKDTRKLRKFLR